MKRFFALLFCVAALMPVKAVLTEKNLNQTLEVLNVELNSTYLQLRANINMMEKFSNQQHEKMIKIMQRSNQVSLMLYSQNFDYTFNLAYACHEAAEQYTDFNAEEMPYDEIMTKLDTEIERYKLLVKSLQELPPSLLPRKMSPKDSMRMRGHRPPKPMGKDPFMLDTKGQANRSSCLLYAKAIVKEYVILRNALNEDSEHYQRIREHLKSMFDYAQTRYKNIQRNIFVNGEDNYFTTLGNFPMNFNRAARDWHNKYSDDVYRNKHVSTEWRGPIVFGLVLFVAFYFIIAILLSNVIVRVLMRKVKRLQEEDIRLKTNSIITAFSLVLFALAVMAVRVFLTYNFIIMASQLLVSFAWLTAIILISLIIRLHGYEIKSALKIYIPIVILGFIVIVCRIIFIPNTVVTLIFSPIMLLFTLWQFISLIRENKKVPVSDRIYAWLSFAMMLTTCIMALSGYVLLAVQVFIWWLIQLTLIQTITCATDWIKKQEEKHLKKKLGLKTVDISRSIMKRNSQNIHLTWFYDLIGMVLLPLAFIASWLFSIYYAAEVFDLTEICINIFYSPFIHVTGLLHCSLFKLVLVVGMFFIFNYISYVVKATYRYLRHRHLAQKNKGVGVVANQANISLFNNLMSILIWGIYIIAVLSILQVPKSGLSLVSAGLATGVGFAMKSIIENFFYGISLMTGRLRSGDWIECEGVRGKVESITYQSTQIVTNEGEVITFMNSTLFNRSFKNLTKNHLYEMSKISVGVAYGSNINKVRELLSDAVKDLMQESKSGREIVDKKRGVKVLLGNFGESSIDLVVAYWTLVEEQVAFDCKVREAIYNTLNENHIEIPFPQRDVNFRNNLSLKSETEKA